MVHKISPLPVKFAENLPFIQRRRGPLGLLGLRKRPRKDNDWFCDGTGTVPSVGEYRDLIRASLVRALMASAVIAATLALAGCYGEDAYQLPTRAMKELSPQTLALLEQKKMPKDSPILVRIFKEESELEVWKQDTSGRFQILKVYPICRWSGDLGPKVHEGDRQAPEGFYAITPDLMNPNSNYYLAINTGFPNSYDKANGRTGALLMIHGDCSSRGCYAMTDEQIGEIYSLARESFLGGQHSFQIQAYPFRMTPINMARHRTNPNMAFWKMIKEGNDHFEVTHLEPRVEVCNRHYVFDAMQPPDAKRSLVFSPTGPCPAYTVAPEIASLSLAKQQKDDARYAQLVRNQRADRADQNRPRRRHEPGLPGTGRRQHPASKKDFTVAAAAGTSRYGQWRRPTHVRQPDARRPVGINGSRRGAGASRCHRYTNGRTRRSKWRHRLLQ